MKFPPSHRPVLLAMLAPVLAHPISAGSLDVYRGARRLIVVSVPQGQPAENVAATLVTHCGKIEERDLKIIDLSEDALHVPAALRLPPEQTLSLRKQFKLVAGDTRPVFILVGKDGGEKDRQLDSLNLAKWFVLIDGMPMRRQEIQSQRKPSH